MNNLTWHPRGVEKEQTNSKASRWMGKKIKIRVEINRRDKRKTKEKINKPKVCSLKRKKKRNWHLARLTKEKRNSDSWNESWDITTNFTEIKRIIKVYYQQQCTKLCNTDDMDKFVETHNLPWLNNEETEKLNRPITSKEIE